MKKLTLNFILLLTLPTCILAQYTGGVGRGDVLIAENNTFLDGTIASAQCYQKETSTINIYPNPFNDNIAINFNSIAEENVTINVESIKGEKVYSKLVENNSGNNLVNLNLSGLENGIYLLYFSNYPNKSLKIIKQ